LDVAEKRQLETQLVKMGLAGLEENGAATPELIQQVAYIVNRWRPSFNRHGEWIDRHNFLRDLLGECAESARQEMYSAIVPHLDFTPYPLLTYEGMMINRVEALVSHRAMRVEGPRPHPIEIAGKKYLEAKAWAATHAVATLHCQYCWRKKRFIADTPAGAMIAARKAGWKRVPDKETCPKCIAKLPVKVFVN
jgi:hypothetical protein